MIESEKDVSKIMNLIGYGLSKFNLDFTKQFGFNTMTAFCNYIVDIGLANTVRAVSNRRDSFDPYFDNGRKGWYQRNQREHIKLFIDSLFGNENVVSFANLVKLYIQNWNSETNYIKEVVPPSAVSKFKQLQETGKEAEFYFLCNYSSIEQFSGGCLEDARLWGDGYDFLINKNNQFLLAEVKGIKENKGSIRLTQNEYEKALKYQFDYFIVVVSNLLHIPKLSLIQNPIKSISLTKKQLSLEQINYHSEFMTW